MLVELLKKFKSKKLLTLNMFIHKKNVNMGDAIDYEKALCGKIQRTDFIPYDNEGNFIEGLIPTFKGWDICERTSSDSKKVATMQTVGNSYKIYFDTANCATIISLEHMIDECTYNDLAIFFEGNLELI